MALKKNDRIQVDILKRTVENKVCDFLICKVNNAELYITYNHKIKEVISTSMRNTDPQGLGELGHNWMWQVKQELQRFLNNQ